MNDPAGDWTDGFPTLAAVVAVGFLALGVIAWTLWQARRGR